jgi:hypothetical protein
MKRSNATKCVALAPSADEAAAGADQRAALRTPPGIPGLSNQLADEANSLGTSTSGRFRLRYAWRTAKPAAL